MASKDHYPTKRRGAGDIKLIYPGPLRKNFLTNFPSKTVKKPVSSQKPHTYYTVTVDKDYFIKTFFTGPSSTTIAESLFVEIPPPSLDLYDTPEKLGIEERFINLFLQEKSSLCSLHPAELLSLIFSENVYSIKELAWQEGQHSLSKYATKEENFQRKFDEGEGVHHRSEANRDLSRLRFATWLPRLAAKIQALWIENSIPYQTRFLHTFNVDTVALHPAKILRLNVDLVHVMSIIHDIAHTPFGHEGEKALNEILSKYGKSFNHNQEGYKILTEVCKILQPYGAPEEIPGLNLTLQTLGVFGVKVSSLKPNRDYIPTLEAYLVDKADTISYLSTDMEDFLNAHLIQEEELKERASLWRKAFEQVQREYKIRNEIGEEKRVRTRVGQLASRMMIEDLLNQTLINFIKGKGEIGFRKEMEKEIEVTQEILATARQKSKSKQKLTEWSEKIIKELFAHYRENRDHLLPQVLAAIEKGTPAEEAIATYIASMTTYYALEQYIKYLGNIPSEVLGLFGVPCNNP